MVTRKSNSWFYILNGLLCALAYVLAVLFIFIYDSFTNLWVLYVGNTLFAGVVFGLVIYENKHLHGNAALKYMIASSLKITVLGVVFSCLLVLLMLFAFNGDVLKQAPADTIHDKTNGMAFMLFLNAIIVNFLFGAFASVMASTSAMRGRKTGVR